MSAHREAREAAGAPTTRAAGAGFLHHLYAATRETALVVALALVLSLVIKTWLLQAFFIPSGSMEDTLLEGDRVIVSKLVPDVVPVQRGDIVVFRDPDHWLPPTTAVDRLLRWEHAGGTWQVIRRSEHEVTIALCRCDGGEEADRFTSSDADLMTHVARRESSEP